MTKFTITGTDLHDAASWAVRTIPGKPLYPSLGGLLLDAGDTLRVTAYDLETSVTASVPATTTEPGRLLVSGKLLATIAALVNRDVNVKLTEEAFGLRIAIKGANWDCPLMDVADYPERPALGDVVAELDAADLAEMLPRVVPAAAKLNDPNLANLGAVKIEGGEDGLTFVATDRYRFAAATIPWKPRTEDAAFDALVPARLLESAARVMESGTINLHGDGNTFGLTVDESAMLGRQIAEPYPNWRNLVPAEPNDHYVVVATKTFAEAVAQVGVMLKEDSVLRMAFDETSATLTGAADEQSARSEVRVIKLNGAAHEATAGAEYVAAGLKLVGSPRVALHFYPRMVLMIPMTEKSEVIGGYRHIVLLRRDRR